jgi:tetratricopeptide (TPR) repeat protein
MLAVLVGCSHPPHGHQSVQAPKGDAGPARAPVRIKETQTALVRIKETATNGPPESIAWAHAHYAAGVVHEMKDELDAALGEYYEAAVSDPDNEWLVLEVSRRFLQNKQPEKALSVLQAATAHTNAPGPVYARLGVVYAQLGKYDQAAAANRIAIQRSPDSLAGYQNLFLIYMQNKREPEALKTLDEAAKQANPTPEYLVELAELYATAVAQLPAQKEKLKPKALGVLVRAEKLKPTSPPLRMRMADGFSLLGDSKKAAAMYQDLLKRLGDMPLVKDRIHAKLASIYMQGSDHQQAIQELTALVHDDPTNPQFFYFLGVILYEEKKPAEAVENLSKAILLRPDFEEAYYALALAQIGQNKTSEALATLDNARRRFRPGFVLEFYTGLAFTRDKAYRQALQHFVAAEVIAKAAEPKHLDQDLYFQLGAASERVADFEQAERYFQKCLELAPDLAEAMNYLGYMWAEHGMKLDKAKALIEKALKAEPKNGAFLDSLGWVYFKMNRPKEALTYVVKAIELTPDPDPTLFDHLGDIYAALKEPAKACEAWSKSLALDSNDEIRKKLEAAGGKAPEAKPKNGTGSQPKGDEKPDS